MLLLLWDEGVREAEAYTVIAACDVFCDEAACYNEVTLDYFSIMNMAGGSALAT